MQPSTIVLSTPVSVSPLVSPSLYSSDPLGPQNVPDISQPCIPDTNPESVPDISLSPPCPASPPNAAVSLSLSTQTLWNTRVPDPPHSYHPSDDPSPPASLALGIIDQVRPNDHLLFPLPPREPLSSSSVTLNPNGIARLLQTYPDKRFVHTLVSIATSGTRIGYEGSLDFKVRESNHRSALHHADIVTRSIQSEIAKGRVKEILALPKNHYFCSPIGLVPKTTDGVQTGWRVIFDLSSPDASSVNDGIPRHYGAIVYETLDDAIRLIAQAGKGAVMMKRDLKSAFRHIPVSHHDHWLLIFEWDGKFFVDMFLPFGLRTAPRIFNLFSEALHWVFETLYCWNVTHYLDDFLFVFPPSSKTDQKSATFDHVLSTMGLTKAPEKDATGMTVTHLGFELDSENMEVRLPLNKKLRALHAIQALTTSSSVSLRELDETLGFLSHCCQVVPLGRPFLRRLFTLLRRNTKRRFLRIRIPAVAKNDIRWWLYFLSSWSSVSIIRLSRTNHDVATDASGVKGIGGVYNGSLFSERVPSRHREKHINWKEMFAILHAFVLWHKDWAGGCVRLACDNSAVVQALDKKSIKGETIRPLQTILLIAAVFDIKILVFWIPSEENIVADAASRHDYEKLADLGFQVSSFRNRKLSLASKISILRQQLFTFLTMRSPRQRGETTTPLAPLTNHSAVIMDTLRSLPPSNPLRTGLPKSCAKPNLPPQKDTSKHSDQPTSKKDLRRLCSTILESNSSSEVVRESMEKGTRNSVSLSRLPSSAKLSTKPEMITMKSTLKRHYVLRLPDSFDLASLHGITPPKYASNVVTFHSNRMVPSLLLSPPPKLTHFDVEYSFNLHPHLPPQSALLPPSNGCSHNSPVRLQTPCFLDCSVHSHDNISFPKSKNCSSEPVSRPPVSPVILYEKELQSLLQLSASPAKTSSSLVDGKVTLSTSISMKSVKVNELKNYSNSTPNSIISRSQRSLLWPRQSCSPTTTLSEPQSNRPACRDLQRSLHGNVAL